jgi:hypothetical protein
MRHSQTNKHKCLTLPSGFETQVWLQGVGFGKGLQFVDPAVCRGGQFFQGVFKPVSRAFLIMVVMLRCLQVVRLFFCARIGLSVKF